MKLVILIMSAAVAASNIYQDVLEAKWKAFKLEYKKQYASVEEDRARKNVFITNKHAVARHNRRYALGMTTFTVGINEFSDWTTEEIMRRNGIKGKFSGKLRQMTSPRFKKLKVADDVNWTQEGAVTPVKNQGRCRSCWAFSATGALEAQNFLATGSLRPLSEQNLIDCSLSYNGTGCDGGLPEFAFIYVAEKGGLDTEQSYPYEGHQGPCRYNPNNAVVMTARGFHYCCTTEDLLKEMVAYYGPVSVAIDANPPSFNIYKSGVYYDENCTATNLTHAMLVVGYGTETPGGDYWLLKNSWGTSWGIEGYMKLARNSGNHCGVVSQALIPLL